MQRPAGDVWTVLRSGDLLSAIVDPFNRRTTYSYDASSNLKSVQDPSGRLTSFTVDANSDLTRMTWPDGSIISLV